MGIPEVSELPPLVAALLGAAPRWSAEHEGKSGGVVFVNDAYWVKRGPRAIAERARLRWLADRGIPVPEVVLFEADVLVLADAGVRSMAAHESPGSVLGAVLRRLHRLPIADCPFDERLDVLLARAAELVAAGAVDTEDFDPHGLTAEQILHILRTERPEETDLVVAHGDYTPSNVLDGGILIDVGGLGVADRYRDLALAVRDLRDDYGDHEVAAFFAAYGLATPDQRRLDYYRLLDELF